MIDGLMGRYAGYRYTDRDDNYVPSMAIQSNQLTNASSDHLSVLFPPWRGGDGVYDRLSKRLTKRGSAVLNYKFHMQILEPDVERTRDSFKYVQEKISEELKKLQIEYRYKTVHLIASSLGNISLAMVAQEFTDFDRATMVPPGSNLAKCVWEGDRTQHIRSEFEEQGIDKAMLVTAWDDLAPIKSADAFTGKIVRMHVSSTDSIIPTVYQEEMVKAVTAHTDDVVVKTSRLGHIASVVDYCLRG